MKAVFTATTHWAAAVTSALLLTFSPNVAAVGLENTGNTLAGEFPAAIPYARFWIGSSSPYYLRHSSATDYPYVGLGTSPSYYERHPSNWQITAVGSKRQLRNSSSGKCIWADQTTTSINTAMASCNTANSHQLFSLQYYTINGISRMRITYSEGRGAFCLATFKEPFTGAGADFMECGYEYVQDYWYYVNPR